MTMGKRVSLGGVRTDGWLERIAEGTPSYRSICDVLGESFFAFSIIVGARITDTLRQHHAEPNLLSWWDYRNLGFQKNDGLRIDYVFANAAAAARCVAAGIDRDERRGQQPSDHAPVWADFEG